MTDVVSSGDMSKPVVEMFNVSKRLGTQEAVSDLSFTVMPGEALGFLGPNGAGKTTTLRLILGFLRPTAGAVRLLGCDTADVVAATGARLLQAGLRLVRRRPVL